MWRINQPIFPEQDIDVKKPRRRRGLLDAGALGAPALAVSYAP
ncbi:hypothetical protein CPter91_5146 [Collimonas pratensis]|uniref:Uncharacterized protein n=1 Tax=Collimonas pratensis TaxID=279113 RepID=A0A127QBJ3_9BURK|nr:hypothetical protein CPter91_5146 [Collimonas pratensis]